MGDYLILEALDQKQCQFYCEKWHLYLAECGYQLDKPTNDIALKNHLRERPRYEAFVVIDERGRASHYEIERKPVLIGNTTLKPNAKGFYLPTIEGYFPPECRRLIPTSKTMGEA